MIQEEIARLTGTLKFNVDNRPLIAFEKRLEKVTGMLQQFGAAANKKFNIKVSLDSKTLRAQLEKATNTKITFKNFAVSEEALAATSKKICDQLDKTPIRLNNIKVDVAELVAQKRFMRTLLGQMQVKLPVFINLTDADKQLRGWKKETESKYKLKIDADISQARFIANVRKSLRAAQGKVGSLNVKIADPHLRLTVDQANLRAQIRQAISQHEFDVRVRVRRSAGGEGSPRGGRAGAVGGGIMGAGMGFMRGAIPGLGAAFAFSQLNQINQQMQAQQNAMTAVMGSEQAGAAQSEWVKNLSNTIGMDYRAVAPSYNKMLASGQTSGLSTESVQNIFKGISEYGRTMGLDPESMKGSMRAVEQMMNKGQVMSEELKGQLAERMPGAISAMAEAAGFGKGPDAVAKLFKAMENGEVKSNAVLEKFSGILAERARQGGALAKAMESTAAQQARMNNAFSDTVKVFSQAGFDAGMGKFFKAMAEGMKDAEPGIKALGDAFNMLIEPVNAVINVGGTLLGMLPKIAELFGLTGGQLAALGVTAGIVMLPFGGIAAAIASIGLALDDLIVYSEGGDSLFGRWVADTPGAQEAVDSLKASAQSLGDTIKGALTSTMEFAKGLEGLSLSDMLLTTLKEVKAILDLINSAIQKTSSLIGAARSFNNGDMSGGAKQLDQFGASNSLWNTMRGNNEAFNQATQGPSASDVFSSKFWLGNMAGGGATSKEDENTAILGQIRDGLNARGAAPLPPIQLTMPITVESGGSLDTNAATSLKERVEGVIRDVISDAMIGLKENK